MDRQPEELQQDLAASRREASAAEVEAEALLLATPLVTAASHQLSLLLGAVELVDSEPLRRLH